MIAILSSMVYSVYGQMSLKIEYDVTGNRVLRTMQKMDKTVKEDPNSSFWEAMEPYSPRQNVFCFTSVHITPGEITQIGVYSQEGYKVLSPKFAGCTLTVDLSNVSQKGVYVIRCVFHGKAYSYSVAIR